MVHGDRAKPGGVIHCATSAPSHASAAIATNPGNVRANRLVPATRATTSLVIVLVQRDASTAGDLIGVDRAGADHGCRRDRRRVRIGEVRESSEHQLGAEQICQAQPTPSGPP